MTKKTNLNWRLKDLPDAVDVAELVDKKIITPEEARELLFNEGKDDSKKVKELEEEVKFLRDLCDKLAAKSNGWPTIIREYHDYRPRYPAWYANYQTVMTSTPNQYTINAGSTSGSGGLATGTLTTASSTKMLSSLN